jgi:predicted secreted hydrolase
MKKIFAIIIIILLSAINLYSQNWQQYPYTPIGSTISFPVDDGPHAINTTTEWWYINLHLIGSAPNYKKYDVMLCYFSKPANMRIFNIADPVSGLFHTDVNRTQFAFSQQAGHWGLSYTPLFINDYSNWTYPADSVPYRYVYHAENPFPYNGDVLDITVTGNRPPLNVGGDGYIAIGDQGDFSYYYSYTNMKVDGSITFNGTTDVITSGIGWIDRQYGPFIVGINPNNSYEWYSMQLDQPGVTWGTPQTPSEFNIWQIYNDTNNIPYTPACRSVSALYADDTQDTTSDFIYERTSYWFDSVNNVYYSSSWRLINPAQDINLNMTPTITNQVIDVTLFKFWEGGTVVKGIVQGQNVDGVGFAELVAKHKTKMEVPTIPDGLNISYDIDHYVINWNASTPGSYPIGGYRVYRSKSNDGYWKYIATTTDLSYNDFVASPDTVYYYTVTSFDDQTATSASDYAPSVTTGIQDVPPDLKAIMVYPNPANDKITIECAGNQSLNLSVYNIVGEILLQKELNKSINEIDISSLSKGVYLIKITDASETVQQKLIKE